MIAEKEIVLTYLVQLLAERGILDRLAFKGGTCIRKMIMGSQGRFSTDLDFTGLEEHDHEDLILAMMEAFEAPFHGLTFAIPDDGYYLTQDGLSWGVSPTYAHAWNASGQSDIKLQVSRRETPTLPIERRPQVPQSYFPLLPFAPVRHCLHGTSRNPFGEDQSLLSAQQGTRYLRPLALCYTTARPGFDSMPRRAQALAGQRHVRPGSPHAEYLRTPDSLIGRTYDNLFVER